MQIQPLSLDGVLLLTPTVHHDARGFFLESFNQKKFQQLTGLDVHFVQDNHSRSAQHVLRGLHYQSPHEQGKLVRVLHGQIYDVVVDIRPKSPTYKQWLGLSLDAEQQQQLWVPTGFAHGFLVTSPSADVLYKTTDYYHPEHEQHLHWNDPSLGINWPLKGEPILSVKDA